MGFNVSGGYAAGAGADGLESLWKLLADVADTQRRSGQEDQRIKIAQQNADDNSALRKLDQESRADARAASMKAQAQSGAAKLSGNLAIGQELGPEAVAALTSGDLGDTVKAPTLGSRNITGSLRMMQSTPNPGKGPSYLGTGPQQEDKAQGDELDRQIATAEPMLRGRLSMAKLLPADKRGGAIAEVMRETAKPTTQPLIRVGRDGKPVNMGDIPAGAHVVNEPAPSGASHGRFSMAQGSDANGKPVMIRTNVDSGEVTVLPMPDGTAFAKRDQPATQDQTNLGLYANRVEQADPVLKKLEAGITKRNPAVFAGQQWLDQPVLQDHELQSYQQASRNFINAVLRRESGAAISASEFAEARKQYLPVPGDSPEVLAQKTQNRQIVFDNFKRGAGPAYRPLGGDSTPKNGDTKTFPNGRKAVYDGHGWVAQ